MKPLRRPLFRSVVTASMLCFHFFAVSQPYAATVNWTAGGNGSWAASGNWDPAAVPLAGDDVIFPFATPLPQPSTITLDAGSVANSLRMQGDYLFSGGSLELASGSFYINRAHQLTLDSQLTGGGGLNLSGGGALRLNNAANSYTGITTVANGTLIISHPAQLGADASPVVVTGSASRGFGGGSLVLDGYNGSGMNFTRDLAIMGYGPITDRSAALASVGNNTISGNILHGGGSVATAINSAGGLLTISGNLTAAGTGQLRFGAVNSAGIGSYHVTGLLSGTSNIEKLGLGTLILDPANASGFSGNVLVNSGSVRVAHGSALGSSTANGALTLGGGVGTLEVRTNAPDSFATRRMQMGTSNTGTLLLDHAVGSDMINQTVLFAPLTLTAGGTTRTMVINSRNGYGVTFVGDSTSAALGGNNNLTVSATGLVTFDGSFWNNTSTTARTMTLTVNTGANALITGNVVASGAAHVLTKAGVGTLTILGDNSTNTGAINVNTGTLAIAHFGSINNNTAELNLGATTTAGILNVIGNDLEAGQVTPGKVFNLAGTTAGGSILANQTGTSPGLIINGGIAAGGAGIKALTLGGSNLQENEIRGAIVNNSASNVTSLYKTGSNTWVLSGANTYTGSTLINNGTLKIVDTFSGGSRNILADNAVVGLGFSQGAVTEGSAGGLFHYVGADLADSQESIGNLIAASGAGTIRVTAGTGGTSTLNIASMNVMPQTVTLTTALSSTGSSTMTVSSTAGLVPGMRLVGGTGAATYIVSITNGTQMVVSATQTSHAVGAEFSFVLVPGSSTVNFDPDYSSTINLGGVTTAGFMDSSNYFNGADFAFAEMTAEPGIATLRAPVYFSQGPDGPHADAGFAFASTTLSANSHNLVASLNPSTSGATTISSLKILGSMAPVVNAADLLTIRTGAAGTSGGILVTGGSATITGSGGITTGGAGTMYIRVDQPSDILYLDTPVTATTTGGLTKTGAGTLVISKQNAHTTGGATHLLEGTIQLAPGGRLSANTVNLFMRQDTVFDMNGVNVAQTATSASIGQLMGTGLVTNTSPDPVIFATAGSGGTFNGTIDEVAGQISYVKMGTSASQIFNGIHNYTGSTTIGVPGTGTTGNLQVNYLANIGENSGIGRGDASDTASNAASLIFGGTTGGLIYAGTDSVSTDRLFTLAGRVVSGTSGGATITNNGINNAALIFSNTSPIAFGSTENQLLRLSGTSLSDNWFYPQITDNTDAGAVTSLTKVGAGLWILGNENNSFSGRTIVNDGILQAQDGSTLPSASGLVFGATTSATAVFQSSGTFTRDLAELANAGTNTVTWSNSITTGGGGFAASTEKLTVAIGGLDSPTQLVWGQDGFFSGAGANARLILGSTTSLAEVEFRNPIDLNGASRTVTVNINTSTFSDFASLTGVISNSGAGGAGITKNGNGVLQILGANTYSGITAFTAGTLIVNSLGNSATPGPSNLGDSTLANTAGSALTLGNGGTTAAILQYTGPGEVSDRMIRLNTTTGSTQIHADGTGPLVLTNVLNDMAAGAKILYLRGSNALPNMITSNLANNGGNLALTIDGGATWILSGNNTYSGATTLSAGALGIGGDSVTGNGTLTLSSASLFAYGQDRVIENPITLTTNTATAFIGDHSLTLSPSNGLLTMTGSTSSLTVTSTNNIVRDETLTINGDVTSAATAARTWSINGSGNTVFNGDIVTTGASIVTLSYTGNGTLTLNGTNTTGGNTTISNAAARVIISSDNVFGTGTANLTSGTLESAGGDRIISNNVTHGGTFIIGGEDRFTFNGTWLNNAGSRTLTVNTPAGIELAGEVRLSEHATTARTLTINGTGDVLISGAITNGTGTGASALSYTGNATLTLTGANTYTGATTLNNANGVLRLSGPGTTLGNGNLTVNAGRFEIMSTAPDQAVGGTLTMGSTTSTYAEIVIGADRTLTLNGGVTYTASNAATANPNEAIISGPGTLHLGSGETIVTIADNLSAEIDMSWEMGRLTGSGILTKVGNGTLDIRSILNNDFTGSYQVNAGAILGLGAFDNNLVLNGGVYEGSGTFTRSLGTGDNQVQWMGSGGFSAFGGDLTVTLAGVPDPIVWGGTGGTEFFASDSAALIFGSATADSVVDFTHNLNLNGGARTVTVVDNTTSLGDKAVLSGVISNGSLVKTGNGFLELTGDNTFTGGVTVTSGSLQFSTVSDNGGAASNLGQGSDGITLSGGRLQFVGNTDQSTNRGITLTTTGILDASGTDNATITFAGAINADGSTQILDGSGYGILTGQITQTGTAADLTKQGTGTWRIDTAQTIADDVFVTEGLLIFNAAEIFTGDDIFIRSGTLRLAVNAAISRTTDDLQISGETSGGGVLDIFGTTGSAPTDIIVGRNVANPSVNPILSGSLVDSVGGGSINPSTLNVRSGTVSADVVASSTVTVGGTTSGDNGGIYSSDGHITGNLTLNGALNLFSGSISGNVLFNNNNAVAKHSPNTVTLSGSNNVAGAGVTTINNGTLRLDFTGNTGAKIGSAGLSMLGGNLQIDGHATTPVTVNAGAMILGSTSDPAPSVVTINTSGAAATLQVGDITRNLGATLRFNPSSADAHFNTTASNTAGDILGGWATYQMGNGDTLFATILGGEIVGFNSTAVNDIGAWTSGADVTESTGFTGSLAGSLSINSLRYDAATAASSIVLGDNDVLNIASGGILITDNASSGARSITGGRISGGANELIVTHDGAAPFTLGSRLIGTQAITKAGTGLMILDSSTNTANGTLRLAGGTVRLQGGNALGDRAAVILDPVEGVVLDVMNSETIGSISGGNSSNYKGMVIQIANNQTLTFNQTAALTYYGNIQATSGTATLTKIGASNLTVADGIINLGDGGRLNIVGGRLTLDINGNNNQITQLASGMTVDIRDGGNLFVEHNGITIISSEGRIANNVGINFHSAGSTSESLWVRHDQNSSFIEVIGGVRFASGVNSIRVETGSTGSSALATIRAASVTRDNQATFVLRGTGTQNTSGPRGQFQVTAVSSPFGAGTGTSLPVIPWALGSSLGGTAAADTFLTTTGASNNAWRPLNLATEYAIVNDTASWDAVTESQNVLINASTTNATGRSLRSLLIATGDGTVDLSGDGSGILTVQSGGFLFSGTGSSTLSGFGGIAVSPTAGEYVFHVMGSSATVASPLTTAGAKVTKSGPGDLILSGINSTVGDVAINEGVLQIADLDNIGGNTGKLILAGGTLRLDAQSYSGDDLSTRTITLISGNSGLDTNGLDLTLAHSIGNGGAGSLTKAGDGILTLNAQANFLGSTTITGGTLRYGLANALPTTTEVTFTGTTAVLDIGEHSSTIGSLVLNSSSNGVLNIATEAILTVSGTLLNGNATTSLRVNGGGTAIINGDVMLTPTTTSRTLQLFVNDGGNVIFNGSISNAASSASAFAKYGNGTLEITQPSFYTGATTIGNSSNVGGTVKVTGIGTLSTGNLTVSNGILELHHNEPVQNVATLSMGGGPAGASSLIDIGAGATLRPTAISFSSTNSNLTAIIQGDGTLDLGTGGITVTINNSAGVEVDMSWEMNTVIGSGLFTKAGAGTLDIRGVENYNFTGSYQINAGAILGLDLLDNNLVLSGGVFEGSGTFTRSLGSGDNQVQWAAGTGGGGFSASGGDLTVTLSGAPDPLVWGGTPFFVPDGAPLIFGSTTADSVVNFTHDIDLNGGNRTITVVNNTTLVDGVAVATDLALLSGDLTNGSITKTGNGILQLGGNNTFASPIIINGTGGTLQFTSLSNLGGPDTSISLQAGFLSFAGNTDLTVPNPININPGTAAQTISLQNLAANGTNGAVVTFSGPITTATNILTLAGDGAGIITGGITQTGTAADVYVTSGNWTLRGSNIIGDDLVVQGPTAVLNLDGSGIITYNTTSSSGLYSRNGAVINLLAANPFVEPGGLDFILLGDTGGVLPGTLNMNGFDLTTPRLDIGQVGADLSGIVLGTATLTVNSTLNLYRGSVEVNLAGAAATVKTGQGEVVFTGDNSGLTGATTVTNGSLRLDYSEHNTRKIGSGNLNMYGGTLIVDGSDTAATSQAVNLLNVGGGAGANTGASTIEINNGTGQQADLTFGGITRTTAGGTVNFALASGNVSVITTASNPANLTSLGGWATVNDTAFATIDGGKIIALTATAKDDVSTWLAGDNVTDASGYTGVLGSGSVNSITFNAAAGSALAIGSEERFIIASGGILVTAGAGTSSLSGGLLYSDMATGTSSFLRELVVHQHSANDFTLSSSIDGTLALAKSGEGILVLDGNNNYTEQTSINEGTLSIFGGNAIGDRSVVNIKNRPGAVLELNNGTETISGLTGGGADGGLVNLGTGTLHLENNAATRVYIGTIEGSGTLIKSGANTQELEGNSVNFTGNLIINRGLIHMDSGSGLLSNAASITINNGGELLSDQDQTSNRDRIGNATVVTLNNTAGTRGLWIRTQSQNASRTETVGSVILGSGHNVIQATNDAGGSGSSQVATLSISSFSREGHATALLRGQNLGGGSGIRGRIIFALPSDAVGGGGGDGTTNRTIVPYLIGAAGVAGNASDGTVAGQLGNSFITLASTGEGYRPLNLTTEYILNAAGYDALTGVTAENVRFAANPAATLAGGSKTINSLVLDSTAGAITATGNAADTLTLASGALLAATTTPANGIVLDGFSEVRTATDEYLIYVTNATSTLTVGSALTSEAALTKSGAGNLILTGANTYTGGTWFNQGFIEVAALNQLGSGALNFHGGGLRWAAGSTFDPTTRALTLGIGGGVFDTNGNDVIFANAFGGGGAGGLTKAGAGTLTLNAAGNFSGPAFVNGGTLTYGVATALPVTTAITLGGGTLNVSSFITTLGALDILASSSIEGSEDLTFTGNVTVNGGGSRTLTINNTGITTFDGDLMILVNTASEDSRTLTLSTGVDATVIINSQITNGGATGGLTKNGDGTVILNSINFHTGTTTVTNGILRITDGLALGSAAGGTTVSGGNVTGTLELTNNITVTGETLTIGARTGANSNTAHLRNFSGDNEWAGPVNFTTGGSNYNIDSANGHLTISGQISGAATTGTRNLRFGGDGNGTVTGNIVNGTSTANINITKDGGGIWAFSGENGYTGGTVVSAGTLLVNNLTGSGAGTGGVTVNTGATFGGMGSITGGVTLNGILSPGSVDPSGISTAGQLTVGTIMANTNSELFLQIGGATVVDPDAIAAYQANPGTFTVPDSWTSSYLAGTPNHDQLNITGTDALTLNTIVTISGDYLGDYTPSYGDVFHFVDWASLGTTTLGGTQNFVNLPVIPGGSWNTDFFSSHGIVFVIPEPSRMMLLFFGLMGLFFRRRRH